MFSKKYPTITVGKFYIAWISSWISWSVDIKLLMNLV